MRSGVAQHAQADACNPDFMFSKMSTPASWDYRLRFPNRFPTVSRRCHPVALASAGAAPPRWRSTEPLTPRHDSPVRSVVPGTSSDRLEPSQPPCGETERCPDSGAPRADAPRVDSPCRGFHPAQTHASDASARAILTTHGHTRRSLRPDGVTSRSRLSTRESEKRRLSSPLSDGSVQRATELALASFRTLVVTDPFAEINEIRLWEIRLFFHKRSPFRPVCPHFRRTTELRPLFRETWMWVSRGLPPW